MKQALLSMIRRPLRRRVAKSPVRPMRELDRASLRHVSGGDNGDLPKTGW
jgi:hypothetical protein